jgi:hypothetical protein
MLHKGQQLEIYQMTTTTKNKFRLTLPFRGILTNKDSFVTLGPPRCVLYNV